MFHFCNITFLSIEDYTIQLKKVSWPWLHRHCLLIPYLPYFIPEIETLYLYFRFTLLFSHGNAVDLGQMTTFFIGLGQRINCNIFSYDYSGYGQSSGKPTEKNLYADIDAAWHALRTRYGISPENIILYGQSIGTVPTVDLASRYEVGAVILHSPLMSGMRVAFPATKRTWFFDAFPRYGLL